MRLPRVGDIFGAVNSAIASTQKGRSTGDCRGCDAPRWGVQLCVREARLQQRASPEGLARASAMPMKGLFSCRSGGAMTALWLGSTGMIGLPALAVGTSAALKLFGKLDD
jgi:hypothetical protein